MARHAHLGMSKAQNAQAMMRTLGRNETVASYGVKRRRHEGALSLAPAVSPDGAEAVQGRGGTTQSVTTEGGIVRFGLTRDAPEAR